MFKWTLTKCGVSSVSLSGQKVVAVLVCGFSGDLIMLFCRSWLNYLSGLLFAPAHPASRSQAYHSKLDLLEDCSPFSAYLLQGLAQFREVVILHGLENREGVLEQLVGRSDVKPQLWRRPV